MTSLSIPGEDEEYDSAAHLAKCTAVYDDLYVKQWAQFRAARSLQGGVLSANMVYGTQLLPYIVVAIPVLSGEVRRSRLPVVCRSRYPSQSALIQPVAFSTLCGVAAQLARSESDGRGCAHPHVARTGPFFAVDHLLTDCPIRREL